MRRSALPRPAAPHPTAPQPLSKESSRGSRGLLCCRLQLSPHLASPHRTWHDRAWPNPAVSTLQREQQRASKGSVLPSATITIPRRAAPCRAPPCLTRPCQTGAYTKGCPARSGYLSQHAIESCCNGKHFSFKAPMLGTPITKSHQLTSITGNFFHIAQI